MNKIILPVMISIVLVGCTITHNDIRAMSEEQVFYCVADDGVSYAMGLWHKSDDYGYCRQKAKILRKNMEQ
jgi:hypothetical protein